MSIHFFPSLDSNARIVSVILAHSSVSREKAVKKLEHIPGRKAHCSLVTEQQELEAGFSNFTYFDHDDQNFKSLSLKRLSSILKTFVA